jgi:uncharacterized protein (DUF362 family)/Pyruvate/2-oxoacid:ferredoxin oxidoreductase delta subunit
MVVSDMNVEKAFTHRPRIPRICIAATENNGIDRAVRFCFEQVFDDEILDGVKKVLIKPNFVNTSPARSGVTVDLRIVSALIQVLIEIGIEQVVVGESSLVDTEQVFRTLDVYGLEKLGAKVVNFDQDEWVKVTSPTSLALKTFSLPRTVEECDLFISVAKLKTHELTMVSLSVKNVLGAISKRDRKAGHLIDIDKAIVDVFSYLLQTKKFISFVDALYGLEGKLGPTVGTPVKMNLIVAGNDPVAVDSACVRLMGCDIQEVSHIALCRQLALGEAGDYKLIGPRIESLQREFEMPPPILLPKAPVLLSIASKLFKKTPYLRFGENCTKCEECVRACPRGAVLIQRGLVTFNYKSCAHCLICCEACTQGALCYKMSHSSTYEIARRAYGFARSVRRLGSRLHSVGIC